LIASCFFRFSLDCSKVSTRKSKDKPTFDVSKSPPLNDTSPRIRKKLAIALAQTDAVHQLNSIHLHDRDATLIAVQLIRHPAKLPP
jgi:hypothetical protein